MHVKHRQTCRLCGSRSLKPVIDIGDQNLQGAFIKGDENPPRRTIPTKLVRCDPQADENACGLLQLAHTVPPELLYSSYWYRSGINATMRKHLLGVVDAARPFVSELEEVRVLDIGCNDGTLLNAWPMATGSQSCLRMGVDPSQIAAQEIRPPIRLVQDCYPSSKVADEQFDVITSIAMFYDLEDPIGFVEAIWRNLAPNGVWIVEVSYMPGMLENNSYDTICHEHLEYYSLSVLENLFARTDLRVLRAELNDCNGGSIRCYVCRNDSPRRIRVEDVAALRKLRASEFDLELDTDKPYVAFQRRIHDLAGQLRTMLENIKRDGKTIHIYGASTKGNTILQYSRIAPDWISYAAERNREKVGAKLIFGEIEIISEESARLMKPDYYLVLPWHFREEILEREKAELERGAGFIFPLPKLVVIGGAPITR